MPFVETTMIAGYGPDVKQRLVTAFTRAVRSVMAAPLDGVVVVLREVDASCWARGGISRTPGPPLPAAVEVVVNYVATAGEDASAEAAVLGPDVRPPPRVPYDRFEEALTDDGSLVFASGALPDGTKVMDRHHVRAGKILAISRWTAPAIAT